MTIYVTVDKRLASKKNRKEKIDDDSITVKVNV